jgi:DNA-directed DNA polymerase III PolC
MFALGISDFSVGEGVYPAKQLLSLARQLGYRDLVCWDRGMAGYPKLRDTLEWIHKSRELEGLPPDPQWTGFRLHLGCRFSWQGHDYGALPFSDTGYAALNRLLSAQAHDAAPGPGIPGLGAPEPPRDCVLLADDLAGLDALLREGLYAALLAHPRRVQEARKALAAGLEVVAPQVLRFRTAEGLEMHRLKRAITRQATLIRTEALWAPSEAAVPRQDWEARFPFCDPAVARATAAVLERISGWNIHWGEWEVARPFGHGESSDDADLNALLRQRVRAGAEERFPELRGDILARMEQELDLIAFKGFARYFLLVQDIVLALKHEGLPTRICGRGSGAASLVSYALHLSNVDPVDTNLMFERFLTKERKDPPDMDIDFAWDERDRVIQAVFERYGRARVAMVSNHAFFKSKGALRAVAQAHGRPDSELKQLARFVRGWEGGMERASENSAWDVILRQAQALKGHFHQFSVHPGGTIVTPGPLWEHAAFQPAPAKEKVSITTWDKDGVENYGLVKIDLLGNRSLAVIRDAYNILGDRVPKDPGTHSRNDPGTQDLLKRGDSIGVFYVESPATRQLQQRVGKGDFETLVIHSSLIRPAAYRWVDRYVKRSRREEVWEPGDPVFSNLLSESFGVLVYQEDVIKVCVELAGWSHYDADQLRKLLGKPDCEAKLPFFEARFRHGAAARGVRQSTIDEAWDMIRTFTGYSFCKPHSASYAQVSFESAWIKTHHPAVFFASVITNQGGYYPAIAYLGDARRHRLVVRGPDANQSLWPFSAEGEQALRVGLMQVRGALEPEVRRLLEEREEKGPFANLDDLLGRVKLSITTAEALCAAGAFDHWAPDGDRTRLMWARLGGVPPGVRPRPTDLFDRADLEMATMGLTLDLHPAALARVRKGGGPNRAAEVVKPNQRLRFWTLVVADKDVATERGERMQFITFEDETGLCEAVAFPDALRKRQRPFRVGEIVCVSGRSTQQDGLAVLEVQ